MVNCPERGVVAGHPLRGFHPHFFCGGKKKTAVELSKEKTLVAAQLRARDAPCRAAGRGSKPFCSVDAAPTRARAGLSSDFRTQYAVLRSEVIGQRPNLTSDSFRAFHFAKRCRGGCGDWPFLMVFASIFGRSSRPLPQSLRYAPAPPGG